MSSTEDAAPAQSAWTPARAGGILMLAGGALAVTTVLLPPAARGSDAFILAAGVTALAVGVALLGYRGRVPEAALGGVVALSTALITLTTHEAGATGGAADNEMLYLWVALYSFYFFDLRHAFGQLVFVGAAYAWLLSASGFPGEALTQWQVTMTTLVVGGLVVYRLRGVNVGLVRQLAQQATRDPLTGVLNRRAIEERAAVELARGRRDGQPLSLLAIDVDDFKRLNDTQGHPAGDAVLRRIAAALELCSRDVDAVARLGGDEFMILLPDTSEDEAELIARRIAREVRDEMAAQDVAVTISVGSSTAPRDGNSFDRLWRAADRSMYLAKHAGGDRAGVAVGE